MVSMASCWVNQMFTKSAQARLGGIVRRSSYDVERLDVLDEIVTEAQSRGFHVIESGGQIILLAHDGSLTLHC